MKKREVRHLTQEEWLYEVNYPNRPRETIPMTPVEDVEKPVEDVKKSKKSTTKKKEDE